MKKLSLAAFTWLITFIGVSAAPLTPNEALQRIGAPTTRGAKELKCVYTLKLDNGDPGLYVFQEDTPSGYLIASADDVAAPLLGYSDSGRFDQAEMSPEMRWWLEEYGRQIEYAKQNGAPAYERLSTRADKAAIAPMISTQWNQGSPYNLQTPEVNGRHCVTGCVATAMAQVMKHWNYPATGKGVAECSISLKDGNTDKDRMMLNEENFDWNNMLDIYDQTATDEQKAAVAYLMKACGYSVSMNYSTSESGAPVIYVATALVNNFFYNQNLQYCQRSYFTSDKWADMIYEELAAGRPVVYGGQSVSGGHCFVCDGYDSDEYFHFNWGWGGMSDGYFLLDALNPGSLGIGSNGGGYNFGQEIVRGIQPTEGQEYAPNFVQQGNMEAHIAGFTMTLSAGEQGGWFNMDNKAITIDLGTKIEPVAPTTGETVFTEYDSFKDKTLQPLYGWTSLGFSIPTSLKDGTYRLTLCFRQSGTEQWIPVLCESDCYNYIEFTKTGLKITAKENKKALPVIDDAEFLTPLYYGEAVKIKITVSNPTGKELTNNFYPALYSNGNPVMKADGITVTLAPGEKVTKEFVCLFELFEGKKEPTADTDYQLCFFDPSMASIEDTKPQLYPDFSKNVTMKIDSGVVDLTINDFSIKDCPSQENKGDILYKVADPSMIPFSLTVTNNAEYYAKPITLVVFPYVPNQQVSSLAVEDFSPIPMITKGESATLEMNLNFISGVMGETYFAMPYIDEKLIEDHIIFFTLTEDTGAVEGIASDEIAVSYDKNSSRLMISGEVSSVVLTSMNGIAFDKTSEAASGSVSLSNLPAGIYIVKAVAPDGTVKTLKIIK